MVEKRKYTNSYPSVTEILKVIASEQLQDWMCRTPYWEILKAQKEGREIGTIVHQCIQDHIELKEVKVETIYPDEVMTGLKSFMLFKKEHPEIIMKRSEKMLTSEIHKINGTLDVEGTIDLIPAIGDWKCVKASKYEKPGIWPNYKIQLSAYIKLNNEMFGTQIESGFSVPIAKDKIAYNLYIMGKEEIDDCFNEAFLPAVKLWNFLNPKRRKQNGL
jgi:hypothetical protein